MAQFYRVTSVLPTGGEVVLKDYEVTDENEQAQRLSAFLDAVEQALTQALHIRIYSSDENGNVTPDDLIWDSEINLSASPRHEPRGSTP